MSAEARNRNVPSERISPEDCPPCDLLGANAERMASMEIDPDRNDTLMHLSGYIFRAAINLALKGKRGNG